VSGLRSAAGSGPGSAAPPTSARTVPEPIAGTVAWIALGANLGDPAAQLDRALDGLRADGREHLLRRSPWLWTAPVGGPPGQPRFLNGVAELSFEGTSLELLALLQDLERAAGRVRLVRHGPRTLDLDLLWFGSERAHGPALELPHPRLEQRLFVLLPLAAVDPELRLPGSGRTVAEQLAHLARAAHPATGPGTVRGP
jgi:2-amino-4-hydroxy-6-hydroxymethyldihydropteridine diphosphokinase